MFDFSSIPQLTIELIPTILKFVIHSALDNFEELDASYRDRPQHGPNSMWVGFLGHFDDAKVYGECFYYRFKRKNF